ncbi:SGNH/GDSL hydrolase family protein [Streptomyces sp. NPDC051320]|uniref:SGNH/GDSL hydrolase family protein n=1 Tax=Streptomyces sp. NPDC051320 TaxID=3154644 RepID=UPI00342D6F9D
MARHRFGGIADYVIAAGTDNVATLEPSVTVTAWNAAIGGTQYTDLTDTDGTTPITNGELTSDTGGAVPEFYGPDGVRSMYLDANAGSGPRRRTIATDIGEDLTNLESTSLNASEFTAAGDLMAGTGSGTVEITKVGAPGQVLLADPVSLSGLSWGNAWRRRNLPDRLLAEALSAETPTITPAHSLTSTIPSAQALLPPDTGPFRYLGAGDFEFGPAYPNTMLYAPTSRYPNTYDSGQTNWALEFSTDASVFEIFFKWVNTATMYRLTVDGRKYTDLPVATGASGSGELWVLKFDFGTSKIRRIRFDLTTFPWGGLFLPPGASAWVPPARGGRLAVFGDSLDDGSGNNTGFGIGTWVYRAGRLLGCTDVWDQGRGGTGYITPGAFVKLGDRVASDITPYDFDKIIVWAGYNDNGGVQSDIAAAADSLYASLKTAALPGADIYVIGCWSPTASPATSIANTDATLKASALAAHLPFISPLSGTVYDRSGTAVATPGPWITAANAAAFIGADGVHPTDAGHTYVSHRIVDALMELMPA